MKLCDPGGEISEVTATERETMEIKNRAPQNINGETQSMRF